MKRRRPRVANPLRGRITVGTILKVLKDSNNVRNLKPEEFVEVVRLCGILSFNDMSQIHNLTQQGLLKRTVRKVDFERALKLLSVKEVLDS